MQLVLYLQYPTQRFGDARLRRSSPGGFLRQAEDLADRARRELRAATGLHVEPAHLEQLGTFGAPDRNPRAPAVSVAYLAVLPALPSPVPGTEAAGATWERVDATLKRELTFDHHEILQAGVARARNKLEYTSLATAFVGPRFTTAELRGVYEVVWGQSLDPGNFHRKVIGSEGFVRRTAAQRAGSRGRPAATYKPGDAIVLHPPILQRGSP